MAAQQVGSQGDPSSSIEEVDPQATKESVKFAADSIGIEKLNDNAANYIAEELTFRLKELVQESLKFVQNSKRKMLLTQDLDHALKRQNVEPLYGFTTRDFVPFRFASGGGREVYFHEESEVDLEELLNQPLPKIPCPVNIKAHWLAIDGAQPNIPENPPPINKDKQLKEILQPSSAEKSGKQESKSSNRDNDDKKNRDSPVKHIDTKFKPLVTHELSVEQQLYYKEITEACVGSVEQKRTEALQSLASDPGLYQLLPRFATFISEGVKINVAQHNLALLIYLLRMIKALMENPTLYLEKYLHELVPSIITCIVSKQLCPKPEVDNHWALRDFAARLMAQLCRTFSCPTNNIQSRITKTLCKALYNDKAALATHYGAVAGLAELGLEVVKVLVLPRLKTENKAITEALESNSPIEKSSAEHLQNLLVKHCSLIAVRARALPDVLDQYQSDFGVLLGNSIFRRVQQIRQGLLGNAKTPGTPTTPTVSSQVTVH
ncbi:transcription initiation factor TFIID subunit 6-like [Rhopilema esculentum]|uniref:transcription initiation factor TFIID subunit 6-like n=1 Tax=Rhopilema esculentum TaxID=499914 RepID=UPI0031D34198